MYIKFKALIIYFHFYKCIISRILPQELRYKKEAIEKKLQ